MLYPDEATFTAMRMQMVEHQLRRRGIEDARVLDAMSRVPRHAFVPRHCQTQAYDDYPLPIGEEQTISQPFIIGHMLELLTLTATGRVLEIGTGSGYVTALLAELSSHVVSMERHATLASRAQEVLTRLGYSNVEIIVGDGMQGAMHSAPYQAILVSAAAPEVPSELLDQLAEAGRLVIPVGPPQTQQLQRIQILGGQPATQLWEFCRFVPLVPGVKSPS